MARFLLVLSLALVFIGISNACELELMFLPSVRVGADETESVLVITFISPNSSQCVWKGLQST